MIEQLYAAVESQYFESGDFNGLPISSLAGAFDIDSPQFRNAVRSALSAEILTARAHGNPHIMAFSEAPKEKVIEYFDSMEYPGSTCLYPHPNRLKASARLQKYKGSPYEMELAGGAGQLDYRTFDLSVLEYYRNDPRYSYGTDFIHGQICIANEYFESADVAEHDQILLQTFGFAYDENMNRYVAVFLRYLADLSPEHQRIWQAKEVKGTIHLHPDYYSSTIEGSWGTRMSIFEAFVQELQTINDMCSIIRRPNLFRHSYSEDRPKEFGFLLRPTVSEFNDFVLLLDKMMSDNINKEFFGADVELETEVERPDGRIEVKPKGTVQLLETWVGKYFKPADPATVAQMISAFKEVRKLRQKPAHKVNADAFDQGIFREQRGLVIRAYDAVRTLRLVLANHPAVRKNPPQINDQLFNAEIWDI